MIERRVNYWENSRLSGEQYIVETAVNYWENSVLLAEQKIFRITGSTAGYCLCGQFVISRMVAACTTNI
jgi:hypothetical protein